MNKTLKMQKKKNNNNSMGEYTSNFLWSNWILMALYADSDRAEKVGMMSSEEKVVGWFVDGIFDETRLFLFDFACFPKVDVHNIIKMTSEHRKWKNNNKHLKININGKQIKNTNIN